MTACRLQSPNWWRTAREALAAARALLDDPPPRPASGSQADLTADDGARRTARAVRLAFEAAVALRLPYDALQPGDAWALGWRGGWQEAANPGGDRVAITACRMVLAAAGERCRRERVTPDRLAFALDHTERAHAVCYTDLQKPSWT